MKSPSVIYFVTLLSSSYSQPNTYKLVSIVDSSLLAMPSWLDDAVRSAERASNGDKFSNKIVSVSIEDETAAEAQFCQAIYETVALVLDTTAGGWWYAKELSEKFGIPYVHAQISIYPWMAAADTFMQSRNATDAALIFHNEAQLDQGLYYLVEGSVIRVIVLSGIQANTSGALKKMRPAPAHYVIFADADKITEMFDQAVRIGLVTRDSRWLLMMTTPNMTTFPRDLIPGQTLLTVMTPRNSICCVASASPSPCSCTAVEIPKNMTINSVHYSVRALKNSKLTNSAGDCGNSPTVPSSSQAFYDALQEELKQWPGISWTQGKLQITPELEMTIITVNSSREKSVGEWSSVQGLKLDSAFQSTKIKRYFRVGTIRSRPWMYEKTREAGTLGVPELEGYCVELTQKLSLLMNFDFEFIFPSDGKYGGRTQNGTWNGLVGDLANGATDIIVAPFTMTSEREEVVDFVAPYFDQSGISIVIRKREREESLFKFMTVLKPEVWVSIVAALIVTGVMLWFLDKYSPYSAQNNRDYIEKIYRKFTLKESFWFALTSFTPQGGGEAPKALSGRTLVAAYWLFVVLMLATFTANLAAFLTVERMQSPVQSLEALAGQAKIGFTTTKDTSTYEYFFNMARAEDELFRVWKELTLNSTSDQSKYRVWDYPIKEQYTHILQVIDDTGPLPDAEAGIKKVMDSTDGNFAFIHDASELRYEVYHNCYLTEIGEPFAEQPYAIAVQQGSHLQDEISRAILELQKDRYFEALTAKFWNSSAKGMCPNESDSEGINLQSLGGVFIATLIGLVLALIALAIEVMYYRRIPEGKEPDRKKLNDKFFLSRKNAISRINVSPAAY